MSASRVATVQRDSAVEASPFLRWAGGKRRLLERMRPHFPTTFGTYFEPFLGGGSVYFALRPATAVLGDVNSRLVETYQAIKTDVDAVIRAARQWANTKSEYYWVRDEYNPRTATTRAAQFLYLNKMCWNGLYRENRRGGFNVPYGFRSIKEPWDVDNLHQVSAQLQTATLHSGDFEVVCKEAKKGDFVYFDPPYVTSHNNNGFIEYNSDLFLWEDQLRLARCAAGLVGRGVQVAVSNAAHDALRPLYEGFTFHTITRASTIAGLNEARVRTQEFVITGGY